MPTTTPGVPGPLRLDALDIAREHLGQRERGGRNRGMITEWSQQGLVSTYKPLLWCAYFASQCFRQAALRRSEGLSIQWARLASGSCDALYKKLAERGWEPNGETLPGDLLFFGQPDDLDHVGIQSTDKLYISGNAGPRSDSVYEGRIKQVIRAIRVPW